MTRERTPSLAITRSCSEWSELTNVIVKLLKASGDKDDAHVCLNFVSEIQMQALDWLFEKQEAEK
jgi:hypothetical protein